MIISVYHARPCVCWAVNEPTRKERQGRDTQMFEDGIYFQLGFCVHAYLLAEKDVHNLLLDGKRIVNSMKAVI
jgi:hypothetical protein